MNLIYQYWNGDPLPSGAQYSSTLMAAYAERIGAHYRLDRNENYFGANAKYFDCLRPIYDPLFRDYNRVLFVDLDVFPVRDLAEDVFDVECSGIGMAEEPHQPEYRQNRTKHINGRADEKWAALVERRWGCIVPRDENGRPRVFNSGVVMFMPDGVRQAGERFVPINEYIADVRAVGLSSFYAIDQNYLHAMCHLPGFPFTVLDSEWNRQVHGKDDGTIYDARTPNTKFVHIQLSGADHQSAEWHDAIVNRA